MDFLDKLKKVTKNVVTLGAAGRMEKKMKEFEEVKYKYEINYSEMEIYRANVNQVLEKVIKVKMKSIKSLKKIKKISENIKGKEREVFFEEINSDIENKNFENINKTITIADMALNATKGTAIGVSTALGSWALVSVAGTASTGTALSSLSGIAATNATLAWFGGGSLAAGGGGIALGTTVLGGVVAIGTIAFTGIYSHLQANKQIEEIEYEIHRIYNQIEEIQKNIIELKVIKNRAEELIISIEKTRQVFEIELEKVYKLIYPYFWTKLIKKIRKTLLKMNYFSKEDLKNISYIGSVAQEFAIIIDTPVFE